MTRTRNLTVAILTYRKNRINHRLLFGDPTLRVRRGWQRGLAVFEPGQIFGYERWHANQYGTQGWRIAICLAAETGPTTKFPGIIPGVVLLLNANGRTRCKRVLALLDTLKKTDESALKEITADAWRGHANALEVGNFDEALEAQT